MKNKGKKICPFCNYLGRDDALNCPHCEVLLISECPKCNSLISTAFAKYCSICGYRFATHSPTVPKKEIHREESIQPDCRAEKQRRDQ